MENFAFKMPTLTGYLKGVSGTMYKVGIPQSIHRLRGVPGTESDKGNVPNKEKTEV